MMSYMMPVMFTVMFLNFASGLNLYYAVQNIAAHAAAVAAGARAGEGSRQCPQPVVRRIASACAEAA